MYLSIPTIDYFPKQNHIFFIWVLLENIHYEGVF